MDTSIVAQGSGLPGVWITDPALLRFEYYRDRCLWGKPNTQGVRSCLDRELAAEPFRYVVRQKENHYANGLDPEFGSWVKALECGCSYMAGNSMPMTEFVRRHSSRLIGWQRLAYQWCIANPTECLILNSKKLGRIYEIKKTRRVCRDRATASHFRRRAVLDHSERQDQSAGERGLR